MTWLRLKCLNTGTEVLGPNIDEGLSAIVIDLLQLGMNKECKDKLTDSLHKTSKL